MAPGGLLRDRYRLISQLGDGQQGITLLAEHLFLKHPCVVKILPIRLDPGTDALAVRLRDEARAGFGISHPNVVRVIDCDMANGACYFVMEFVDGVDLGAMIHLQPRLPWVQVVELLEQAAAGLGAIHRAGLLHLDLKPSNLLLGTDGVLRIADLGVSRAIGAADATTNNDRPGTFEYAAPEVFEPSATVGPAADLYSLGASAFHLLTGETVRGHAGVLSALLDAPSARATWPASAAELPRWLIDAISRLLEPDPTARFRSAAELLESLRHGSHAAGAPSDAAGSPEPLVPRGVAILPFRQTGADQADAWLGYAMAEALARELSQVPGLYIADHDRLQRELARMTSGSADASRVLAAARLVGAATVIDGCFERRAQALWLTVFVTRGEPSERRELTALAGALPKLADLQTALRAVVLAELGQAGAPTPPAPARRGVPLAAQEQFVLGKQAYMRGEYDAAQHLTQAAVLLAPTYIEALEYLGACHARLGRYEESARLHTQVEQLAQASGDLRVLVEAHANMGVLRFFKGEYEAAHALYQDALETAQRLGLLSEQAQINNNLGFALLRLERLADAEAAFRRAIETHRSYGALVSLIAPYNGLGNVLHEQHRYDEAAEFYRRALALAQEIGDRTNVGVARMNLGRCAAVRRQFDDAKSEFAMAQTALEETGFLNGLTRLYEYMSEMNLILGGFAEAARCADKRIELARRHANRRMEAAAWTQKAEALERAGRRTEAEDCRVQARAAQG